MSVSTLKRKLSTVPRFCKKSWSRPESHNKGFYIHRTKQWEQRVVCGPGQRHKLKCRTDGLRGPRSKRTLGSQTGRGIAVTGSNRAISRTQVVTRESEVRRETETRTPEGTGETDRRRARSGDSPKDEESRPRDRNSLVVTHAPPDTRGEDRLYLCFLRHQKLSFSAGTVGTVSADTPYDPKGERETCSYKNNGKKRKNRFRMVHSLQNDLLCVCVCL